MVMHYHEDYQRPSFMSLSSRRLIPAVIFIFLLYFHSQTRSFLELSFLEKSQSTSNSSSYVSDHTLSVGDPTEDVLRIWKRYKQEHSVDALRAETTGDSFSPRKSPRKFAVGFYSCPLQAGNRLHHFMNSLIWAVITNRTLLWKYYDQTTCNVVGQMYAEKICQAANQETDCRQVLKRAHWLPALQEWKAYYKLPYPITLSYWTTHQAQATHRFWYNGAENETGVADSIPARLVDFPQMLGQDASILSHKQQREELLSSTEAQLRAKVLVGAGADFLYGLMFFESFAFQPQVSVPVDFARSRNSTDTMRENISKGIDGVGAGGINVVVHSRHSDKSDDGSSIKREVLCLERILSDHVHEPCQVMLLSDRPLTLKNIILHLNDRYPHCEPLVAPHDIGVSFTEEHGPFSGMGFYQDLVMVANHTRLVLAGKVAFVGTKRRSSSQLVREIMTYELHQHARSVRSNKQQNLTACYLEDVEPKQNL
jgi:hypothetical protein